MGYSIDNVGNNWKLRPVAVVGKPRQRSSENYKMKLRRISLRYLAPSVLVLVLALPLGAQETGSVRVNIQVPDSVAHVVDRQSAAQSAFAIVSRDRTAALLLFDTTIVAQMTDHALARMNSRATTDTTKGAVSRLLARMA